MVGAPAYAAYMAERFHRFEGRLNPSDIAAGINAAKRNALRLVSDARMLLDAGRRTSAAALAALAIEEAGKPSILRSIALAKTDDEAKKEWRRFRSHRSKNGMWIVRGLLADGARHLWDFFKVGDEKSDHTKILDRAKQFCLYVDYIGAGKWSEPAEYEEHRGTSGLVEIAESLMASVDEVTTREIELWVEHLGPVFGTPFATHGLLNWHDALLQEGLTAVTREEFRAFVLGPVAEPAQA